MNLSGNLVFSPHMPKVSICIPAFKAPQFFTKVIDSVAAQKYPDYEVIVTDDSPDDSIHNILAARQFSAPLTYIRNIETLGSARNWNKAVGLAKGEYIKIMHHDDWFLSPGSLDRFVAAMDTNTEIVMVFSAAEAYDQDQSFKFVHSPTANLIASLRKDPGILFFGNIIGPPSSIMYRNQPGFAFDEKLKWLIDIDFYMRLLQNGKGFAYIEEPLVAVTVDSNHQVTRGCQNNKNIEIREYLYLYSKCVNQRKLFLQYLKFFSHLFRRFSIASGRELSVLAPNVVIPWYFKLMTSFLGMTRKR
jgi:glycosyltransferase involved in cell wall biosynthesis